MRDRAFPAIAHHLSEREEPLHCCAVKPLDPTWRLSAMETPVTSGRLTASDHCGCCILSGRKWIALLPAWLGAFMDESREQLPDTVTSIGSALAEAAYRLTRFPAAVVVSDPTTRIASVMAASVGTDRRLLGRTVALTSAAGRACLEDVTTYARDARELLGRSHADRRQREEHGIAMSLLDGHRSVGALIVFAPTDAVAPSKQEQLGKLAGHAGHLIGKNLAVQLSQQLGLIDAITGQPNGPGLEKAMLDSMSKQCSLVSMAIDEVSPLAVRP